MKEPDNLLPDLEQNRSRKQFRGDISRNKSKSLLQQQPVLLDHLPELTSTFLENHSLQFLQTSESITGAQIAANMLGNGIEEEVKQRLNTIEDISDDFEIDLSRIKDLVHSHMLVEFSTLSLPNRVINRIFEAPIELQLGFGPNFCENFQNIVISKHNLVRRALDYQAVFGYQTDLQSIVDALTRRIVAHEIGHVIDGTISRASILTSKYDLGVNSILTRAERFAEYWGRSQFETNGIESDIVSNECLLQVAGTYQIWTAIDTFDNKVPNNDFSIISFFDYLHDHVQDTDVLDHVETRQGRAFGLYKGVEPELYASPYPQEIVYNAIERQLYKYL